MYIYKPWNCSIFTWLKIDYPIWMSNYPTDLFFCLWNPCFFQDLFLCHIWKFIKKIYKINLVFLSLPLTTVAITYQISGWLSVDAKQENIFKPDIKLVNIKPRQEVGRKIKVKQTRINDNPGILWNLVGMVSTISHK